MKADDSFPFDFQVSLSRLWIMGAYELIRTVCARWIDVDRRLLELRRKLELVRVPLTKLEIAKDKKHLRGGKSIDLVRRGDPPEQVADVYTADGLSTFRAQTEYDPTSGSVGWNVIDLEHGSNQSIMRRDISNELMSFLMAQASKSEG